MPRLGRAKPHKPVLTRASLAPAADFSGTPLSGSPPPLTVVFTDLSTNTPTSWAWDFGDAGTSTSQNPSHTYTTTGTFTVTLTATGAGGTGTMTKTGYVVVSPAGAGIKKWGRRVGGSVCRKRVSRRF